MSWYQGSILAKKTAKISTLTPCPNQFFCGDGLRWVDMFLNLLGVWGFPNKATDERNEVEGTLSVLAHAVSTWIWETTKRALSLLKTGLNPAQCFFNCVMVESHWLSASFRLVAEYPLSLLSTTNQNSLSEGKSKINNAQHLKNTSYTR